MLFLTSFGILVSGNYEYLSNYYILFVEFHTNSSHPRIVLKAKELCSATLCVKYSELCYVIQSRDIALNHFQFNVVAMLRSTHAHSCSFTSIPAWLHNTKQLDAWTQSHTNTPFSSFHHKTGKYIMLRIFFFLRFHMNFQDREGLVCLFVF